MKKLHYPLWYRLDNRDRYLLWYSVEEANDDGDLDGVVLDTNGRVPVFPSRKVLLAYAQAKTIPLEDGELNLHNLDVIVKWLKVKRSKPEGPTAINCAEFLAAWNLFNDVSRSTDAGFDADRDRTRTIYNKLFWGNNLPSVTPMSKCYVPLWSKSEKKIIREVLSQGLQMFRSSLQRHHN